MKDSVDAVLHLEVGCLVSALWKMGQRYQTYFNEFHTPVFKLNHQPNMFELETLDHV